MAGRREKIRRVGIIPEYRGFIPDGLASGDAIDMTVDELEALRLCDLEGLNQEAVAQQMALPAHGGGNLQPRASQGGKRAGQRTSAHHRGRQYRVLPHHHSDGRMASKGGRHHEGGNHVRQRQHLYALWPQRAVQDLRHSRRQGAQRAGRGHRRHRPRCPCGPARQRRRGHAHLRRHWRWRYQRARPGRHHSLCGRQGSCDACVEAIIAGTLAQNGEATCGCHGHDHDHAHEHGESCSCHGHHEHEGHEAAAATNGKCPGASTLPRAQQPANERRRPPGIPSGRPSPYTTQPVVTFYYASALPSGAAAPYRT